MKVTDDMVARARAVVKAKYGSGKSVTEDLAREMIEAALMEIPDSPPRGLEVMHIAVKKMRKNPYQFPPDDQLRRELAVARHALLKYWLEEGPPDELLNEISNWEKNKPAGHPLRAVAPALEDMLACRKLPPSK